MASSSVTPEPAPRRSPNRPEAQQQGILRLDLSKPRRSSGGSVDFRVPCRDGMQVEPPSPQPSVDRLSVTFRDRSDCSDTSVTVNVFDPGSPPAVNTEMVTFCTENQQGEDDDDYSVSVSQILQRRESTRRGSQRRRKRRPSSPFSQQDQDLDVRRRSSVYTNSSMETGGSAEEGTAQEQIFENIRLHKEVLSSVKLQPWSVRRKIKLVKQAKKYVKKHEGELQERLAQSRSTKDIWARFNIVMVKNFQYFRRELVNMMTQLIPWELRIKEIESHFGSAVASYFTFLRWMFWVNLVITVVLSCFVMAPELLVGNRSSSPNRMQMTPEEEATATYFMTMWDFEGALKHSLIFYGFYSDSEIPGSGYKLPFAYFMTGIAVYVYSFIATLRRMAENSRQSKLSEKDDECGFTWKLFSGWDYMIGNAETAHNRVASIILGFKESLLEETEKKKEEKNWRILGMRVLVNLLVLSLLTISAYIVFIVVLRSVEVEEGASWFRQNEITVAITIITMIFPIFFEILGILESYHPRKSLRIQLARIMILNLLNLYTLIFSSFWKISNMVKELQSLKPNDTTTLLPTPSGPLTTLPSTICHEVLIECSTIAVAATVLTTTVVPLVSLINNFSSTTWEPSSSTWETPSTTGDPNEPTFEYVDYDDETTTTAHHLKSTWEEVQPTTTEDTAETTWLSTDFTVPSTTERVTKPVKIDWLTNVFAKAITGFKAKRDLEAVETDKKCYRTVCEEVNETTNKSDVVSTTAFPLTKKLSLEDPEVKKKLSKLCWETMFGQELVKLTVMDLVLTVINVFLVDFLRAVIVRLLNPCWCWDLEKTFPQYGDFKIAENILHLVNNQGMVWMGMFFSPGLPAINLIKLVIMMYLRSWAVLTCNVPHEVVFRASRSNNFYLALLLTMLFLCVLPVGFAIVWIEPSWHCGPFSSYSRIYHIITRYLKSFLPTTFQTAFDYIASPAIIIPLLMLLVLIIYYLVSLTGALREANSDLKIQLRKERTEERRKMFQLVDRKNRKGSGDSDAFARWKNILPDLPPKAERTDSEEKPGEVPDSAKRKKLAKKELISRLLKRAVSSGTSDEENAMPEDVAPIHKKRSPLLEAMKSMKASTIQETPKEEGRKEKSQLAKRTSVASDKIPVIKISKTESEECILDKKELKLTPSPKKRFRQAVMKQIEEYRERKRGEKRVVMTKLYGKKLKSVAAVDSSDKDETLSEN